VTPGDVIGIRPTRALPRAADAGLRALTRAAILACGLVAAYLLLTSGAAALAALAVLVLGLGTLSWLRRPAATLTVMVGAVAFEGMLRAYSAGLFPVAKFADVLIVSCMLAATWRYVTGKRPGGVRWSLPLVVLAAYMVGTLLSLPFAPTGSLAPDGFRRTVFLTTIIFPMALIQWPPEVRLRALKGIAGVAFLVSLYALFRKVAGPSFNEAALASAYDKVNGDSALFSPAVGRQDLAGWIAVTLPTVLALALMQRGRWRLVCAVATVLLGVELFFTNTRIGLVAVIAGLAVGGLLMLGARASTHYRATIAVALVVCSCAGLAGYTLTIGAHEGGTQRYSAILHPSQDASASRHIDKWKQTMRDLRGHPWGYGMGAAGTTNRAKALFINQDSYFIDSSYLELAFQQGYIVAGIFFSAAILLAYALASAALTMTDRLEAGVAAAACAAVVAWLALLSTGSFIERWCTLFTFLLAGIALAPRLTPAVARHAQA